MEHVLNYYFENIEYRGIDLSVEYEYYIQEEKNDVVNYLVEKHFKNLPLSSYSKADERAYEKYIESKWLNNEIDTYRMYRRDDDFIQYLKDKYYDEALEQADDDFDEAYDEYMYEHEDDFDEEDDY